MSDLYLSPTLYGGEDVVIDHGGLSFNARIYFPTDTDYALPAVMRPGMHDLVVFAHGQRRADMPEGLCPEDVSTDYQLWEDVLHLLARCGFVVVSPQLSDIDVRTNETVKRIEATVAWMRTSWRHASSLWRSELPDVLVRDTSLGGALVVPATAAAPSVAPHVDSIAARSIIWRGRAVEGMGPIRNPTSTALIGHSWGARACAVAAGRRAVAVRALASIAGSFDDNESGAALIGGDFPTLMIAGEQDGMALSYLQGLWDQLPAFKHQAVLEGAGHWDWSGSNGIQLCDPAALPRCPAAARTASELILGFLTKYLHNRPLPPHLLGPAGQRPPLLQWYDDRKRCALTVRWDDPSGGGNSTSSVVGSQTFGVWEGNDPFRP